MEAYRLPNYSSVAIIWIASLLIHILMFGSVQLIPQPKPAPRFEKVSVNIVAKPEPPTPKVADEIKPEPKPAPKMAKTPPNPAKMTPNKASSTQPAPQPVLGLSKESMASDGQSSFSVPFGNTTMTQDKGKRLTADEIQKLDRDLSEDAKLISGTFVKPEYTDEATDAGLEGSFVIEIFVNAEGLVTEAELRKKIGFGMDERVLAAAKKSRFSPRKNPLGEPLEGWTEIKIRLTLE